MRSPTSTIRKMIIFRNRSFGLLWTSQLLSSSGNWLLQVAVPVYVFRLTRSSTDTGLTVVAELMPLLFLAPVAGIFADRWPRLRIMISTNVVCAGAVSLLMLTTGAGQLWLVLLAVVAENCSAAFFGPAYQGVVPALVGRQGELAAANAWSAAAGGAIRLTCAPLGGALYAVGGLRLPVAIDVGTYLGAALLVCPIRVPRRAASRPAAARLTDVVADLRVGVAALVADRVLTALLAVSALFLLGNGACSALLVPYVVSTLGVRAASIGGLFCALGVGYVLSSYVGRRAASSQRLRAVVIALLGLLVLSFAGLFDVHHFVTALIFITLMGLGGGSFLLLEQTILQRRAPDRAIGRISSAYSTVVMAATLAGALLASLTAASIGRPATLNIAIAVIASGGLVATLLPARVSIDGAATSPPASAFP